MINVQKKLQHFIEYSSSRHDIYIIHARFLAKFAALAVECAYSHELEVFTQVS